jgi:hypothetical protein
MAVPSYGYNPQAQAKDGPSGKTGSYGVPSGNPDYRYGQGQSPVSPYGGYPQHHSLAQHPQIQPPATTNGFTGYPPRSAQLQSQQGFHGTSNPRQLVQQQQQHGRFGDHGQANGYDGTRGAEYYGGVGQGDYGYGVQAHSAPHGVIGGRGGAPHIQGRKTWQ